jgi:type I restriction enzyme, S subunit
LDNTVNHSTLALGDVVETLIDYRGKTPPKSNSGVPLITAKVIKRGRIIDERMEFVSKETYSQWMRRGFPRQWDVLITTEAPLGEVGLLRSSEPVALAQRVILLRANPAIADQRFLFYALQGRSVQDQLAARASGTTVLGIKQSELRKVGIFLPPIEKQRRIASILSAYDDLIENNTRRIAVLEEMARRVYEEWFVRSRLDSGAAGQRPDEWGRGLIESVCVTLQAGSTPSRNNESYWDGGEIDWYSTGELRDNFLFGSKEQITLKALNDKKARMYKPGTIFMAIYGSPTVGRLGITTKPSSCNQASLGVVPDSASIGVWYLYFKLMELRAHFNSLAQGAAQQNISKVKVANTEIDIPPRPLVTRFDAVVGPMMKLVSTLTKEKRNLRAQRDLLLPRLIAGEIDVQLAVEDVA